MDDHNSSPLSSQNSFQLLPPSPPPELPPPNQALVFGARQLQEWLEEFLLAVSPNSPLQQQYPILKFDPEPAIQGFVERIDPDRITHQMPYFLPVLISTLMTRITNDDLRGCQGPPEIVLPAVHEALRRMELGLQLKHVLFHPGEIWEHFESIVGVLQLAETVIWPANPTRGVPIRNNFVYNSQGDARTAEMACVAVGAVTCADYQRLGVPPPIATLLYEGRHFYTRNLVLIAALLQKIIEETCLCHYTFEQITEQVLAYRPLPFRLLRLFLTESLGKVVQLLYIGNPQTHYYDIRVRMPGTEALTVVQEAVFGLILLRRVFCLPDVPNREQIKGLITLELVNLLRALSDSRAAYGILEVQQSQNGGGDDRNYSELSVDQMARLQLRILAAQILYDGPCRRPSIAFFRDWISPYSGDCTFGNWLIGSELQRNRFKPQILRRDWFSCYSATVMYYIEVLLMTGGRISIGLDDEESTGDEHPEDPEASVSYYLNMPKGSVTLYGTELATSLSVKYEAEPKLLESTKVVGVLFDPSEETNPFKTVRFFVNGEEVMPIVKEKKVEYQPGYFYYLNQASKPPKINNNKNNKKSSKNKGKSGKSGKGFKNKTSESSTEKHSKNKSTELITSFKLSPAMLSIKPTYYQQALIIRRADRWQFVGETRLRGDLSMVQVVVTDEVTENLCFTNNNDPHGGYENAVNAAVVPGTSGTTGKSSSSSFPNIGLVAEWPACKSYELIEEYLLQYGHMPYEEDGNGKPGKIAGDKDEEGNLESSVMMNGDQQNKGDNDNNNDHQLQKDENRIIKENGRQSAENHPKIVDQLKPNAEPNQIKKTNDQHLKNGYLPGDPNESQHVSTLSNFDDDQQNHHLPSANKSETNRLSELISALQLVENQTINDNHQPSNFSNTEFQSFQPLPQPKPPLKHNELPNRYPIPSSTWPFSDHITTTIFSYMTPDVLIVVRQVCHAFQRYSEEAAAKVRHLTLLSDEQAGSLIYSSKDELGPFFYTNTFDRSYSSFRTTGNLYQAEILRTSFVFYDSLAELIKVPQIIVAAFPNVTSLTFAQRNLSVDFFHPLAELLKLWSHQLTSLKLVLFTENKPVFGRVPPEQAWKPDVHFFETEDSDSEDFTYVTLFRALISSLNNLPKLRKLTLKYSQIFSTTFDEGDLTFLRHLEEFHLVGVPLYGLASACKLYLKEPIYELIENEDLMSEKSKKKNSELKQNPQLIEKTRRISFFLNHYQTRPYCDQSRHRFGDLYIAQQHLLANCHFLFNDVPKNYSQINLNNSEKDPNSSPSSSPGNALTRAHIGSNLTHRVCFDHRHGFRGDKAEDLAVSFGAFFAKQPNLEYLDLYYLPRLPSFGLLTRLIKKGAPNLRFIDGLVVMGEEWPELSPSPSCLIPKEELKGLRIFLKRTFHHEHLIKVFTELATAFPKLNCLRITDLRTTGMNLCVRCLSKARAKKKSSSKTFFDEGQFEKFITQLELEHSYQVLIESKFEFYSKSPARVDCFVSLLPELKKLFPETIVVYE